jgi:adenosylcobinamide-phosphate synthase
VDIVLVLLLALAVDSALGEPPRLIHPVVWMGKAAAFLERGGIRLPRRVQFVYGIIMTLFLVGLFASITYFLLYYLKSFNFIAYIVIGGLLLKSTFSVKELRRVALRVKGLLLAERLDEARCELRSLVSRETSNLPVPLVVSATVESVAENTCDSFVAPLFYFLFLGVPGAVAYRVVNTLDAMIGYHGEYEYLGKFVSRLDDVLNFIPARLTALFVVLSGLLLGKGARMSWQVALGEHAKTESPNAGWPMAAVAGALRVQLEKVGHYKLGRENAPLDSETIDGALKLVLVSMLSWSLICFVVGVICLVVAS